MFITHKLADKKQLFYENFKNPFVNVSENSSKHFNHMKTKRSLHAIMCITYFLYFLMTIFCLKISMDGNLSRQNNSDSDAQY